MGEIVITVEQLRGMIGVHVRYQGTAYRVIEVLEDGPSLVLLDCGAETTIQPNLLGNPTRRVPHTETVRVLSEDRRELHSEFLALELY